MTAVTDPPVCNALNANATVGTEVLLTPACSDVDGDQLTYRIMTAPPSGAASVKNGRLAYTPAASGPQTFTYAASDGIASSGAATVTVTVAPGTTGGIDLKITNATFAVDARRPTAFWLRAGSRRAPVPAGVRRGRHAGAAERRLVGEGEREPVLLVPRPVPLPAHVGERVIAGIAFDVRHGTWTVIGAGAKGVLRNLRNPVTVTLRIGTDEGSATITAAIH